MRRATVMCVIAAVLGLVGCAGFGTSTSTVTSVGRSVGTGADRTWVFAPSQGKPRSVVVFLHGQGDQLETTPAHHRPWLDHLAVTGSYVLYPRYELRPGAEFGMKHAVLGTLAALDDVDPKRELPLVLVGYSRGGGMAVAMAAIAPAIGIEPRAVLGVFPADMEPAIDYSQTPRTTRVLLLVGDADTVVANVGAARLADRLLAAGFPPAKLKVESVRSTPEFQATHLSVLSDSEGARKAFWQRADTFIDAARN